jgi:hypothetical protein
MLLGGTFRVVFGGTPSEIAAFRPDVLVLGRRRKPPESMMKWTPLKVASMSPGDPARIK